MSNNILAQVVARTIGALLGNLLAPITSCIPWPLRLGCGCLAAAGFLGGLLLLALLAGAGR